ncbi:MAG: hypothetical protein QM796_00475 [Chthoniobacteraceae bacterium]
MSTNKKNCFIIGPIGEDGSDIRKRADQLLKHVITLSVEPLGYGCIRADKISEPGLITSQIIQHIVDDPLVVADLTGSNPNVFYELALRHAIRKPLIQLIRKGDKLPFDVAGMRTIPVDLTDPDSIEEARSEIGKQVKAIEGKRPEELDSPVSVAMELQLLRHSEKPEERSLAQVLSAITDLRTELAGLDKKVSDPARFAPPEHLRELTIRSARSVEQIAYLTHEFERLLSLIESGDTKDNKESRLRMRELQERLKMMLAELRHSMR